MKNPIGSIVLLLLLFLVEHSIGSIPNNSSAPESDDLPIIVKNNININNNNKDNSNKASKTNIHQVSNFETKTLNVKKTPDLLAKKLGTSVNVSELDSSESIGSSGVVGTSTTLSSKRITTPTAAEETAPPLPNANNKSIGPIKNQTDYDDLLVETYGNSVNLSTTEQLIPTNLTISNSTAIRPPFIKHPTLLICTIIAFIFFLVILIVCIHKIDVSKKKEGATIDSKSVYKEMINDPHSSTTASRINPVPYKSYHTIN